MTHDTWEDTFPILKEQGYICQGVNHSPKHYEIQALYVHKHLSLYLRAAGELQYESVS